MNEIKCPNCEFEGDIEDYKKGKVAFFTFSLIDAYFAEGEAEHTIVCPKCGTKIQLPYRVHKRGSCLGSILQSILILAFIAVVLVLFIWFSLSAK